MTSDRPYREALRVRSVRQELQRQAGQQFDPAIVAALVSPAHWASLEAAIGIEQPAATALSDPELRTLQRKSHEQAKVS
jgi:response regulator RpfG family c-di-GMP phosphodiesterase